MLPAGSTSVPLHTTSCTSSGRTTGGSADWPLIVTVTGWAVVLRTANTPRLSAGTVSVMSPSGGVVLDLEQEVAPELLGGERDGVGVVDRHRHGLGDRGIELADLVVGGDVLVELVRGDLGQIEVVAHAVLTVVSSEGKPRPTWALIW